MTIIKGRLRPEGTNNYADVVHLETSADQIVETTDKKVMTATERTKLNGIAAGAQVNPTASQILASLKTVDGAGSGLDADLLDGKQASAFQTFVSSYGKTSFNEPIGANLITKQIPIGAGKTRAMVVVQPSSANTKGILAICGMDKTKTYAVGYTYTAGGVNSRQINSFVTQYNGFGSDVAGQYVEIIDMYISGSNLVMVFNNNITTGQEFTIKCTIAWEAW